MPFKTNSPACNMRYGRSRSNSPTNTYGNVFNQVRIRYMMSSVNSQQ